MEHEAAGSCFSQCLWGLPDHKIELIGDDLHKILYLLSACHDRSGSSCRLGVYPTEELREYRAGSLAAVPHSGSQTLVWSLLGYTLAGETISKARRQLRVAAYCYEASNGYVHIGMHKP
jgi:hypothetical protein